MSSSSSDDIELSIKPSIFFDKKNLDHRKKKPKIEVYEIHLCSKCKKIASMPPEMEVGAWSALIVKHLQDFDTHDQNTYMISGVEKSHSHIRIRLLGVKEVLDWITSSVDESQYGYIEAVLYSNDVFVVNTLREWIPKWSKSSFRMGKGEEMELRPNNDILQEIARISTKIKFQVKWLVDASYDMSSLHTKVMDMLEHDV